MWVKMVYARKGEKKIKHPQELNNKNPTSATHSLNFQLNF
jgi:hypothetical protein